MLLSAELGGPECAGLMTGVGVAFLLAGILLGAPLFGLVVERSDSYAVGWATSALLAAGIGLALGLEQGSASPPSWAARVSRLRAPRS